jgi:hypothetical protein
MVIGASHAIKLWRREQVDRPVVCGRNFLARTIVKFHSQLAYCVPLVLTTSRVSWPINARILSSNCLLCGRERQVKRNPDRTRSTGSNQCRKWNGNPFARDVDQWKRTRKAVLPMFMATDRKAIFRTCLVDQRRPESHETNPRNYVAPHIMFSAIAHMTRDCNRQSIDRIEKLILQQLVKFW